VSPIRSSALDHAFGTGKPFALTVEEEAMLLDPETFDLAQRVDSVLAGAGGDLAEHVAPELMQSSIGVATLPCADASELARELGRIRGALAAVAHERELRLGVAGTHPFSLFERQRITTRPRYRSLVDQLQYIARRELVFGLNVHVAVPTADLAVKVADGLAVELPALLALSASSPFWRGEVTGLASSRRMVVSALPRSGPMPRFASYEEYAAVVGQLERTGCIDDTSQIWWDVSPNPPLGTVEIRVCDAVTSAEDAVAIAAFCQAAAKAIVEKVEKGVDVPSYHRVLTSENLWLAARHGLEAPVIDLPTGRRNRVPIAQLIRRSVRDLAGHARELGSERELEGVRAILAGGNGADRQLRVFNTNRDVLEVAHEIADATAPEATPAAGAAS
jgi:carboxylate-amine ligase